MGIQVIRRKLSKDFGKGLEIVVTIALEALGRLKCASLWYVASALPTFPATDVSMLSSLHLRPPVSLWPPVIPRY